MDPFLYVAGGLYVVVIAAFIVMENRRPQSAFAWMLLFLTFPGVGFLIYILFGRERKAFSRKRALVQQDLADNLEQTLDELREQHERALQRMEAEGSGHARLVRLVRRNSNSVLTTQNRLEVLQDAVETYPRLIEDLKGARTSIHLQYYSWASDEFGRKLKAILLSKAAEGVEVRVLYDPVGSLLMLSPFYVREMRKGGVSMAPFSSLWRLHTISYRNHRKIAVIDGTIGYTGGLNIGHEHIDPGPPFDNWRDTHLRVIGSAAAALQAVFAVDWYNAMGDDLLEPPYFPPVPDEAARADLPVQLALSGPDSEWQAIRQLYFAMIVAARQRICLQSPFFILDDSIAEALKAAALAGVDVRIMLSERGRGQTVPYWAANTYVAEIAAAGAQVYFYRSGYLHAKTLSVDSEICSVGSANMDIRSFSINYELNAVIYDEATAKTIEAAFERDLARCMPFTREEYRSRNRLLRLRDSIARLFSPLL